MQHFNIFTTYFKLLHIYFPHSTSELFKLTLIFFLNIKCIFIDYLFSLVLIYYQCILLTNQVQQFTHSFMPKESNIKEEKSNQSQLTSTSKSILKYFRPLTSLLLCR